MVTIAIGCRALRVNCLIGIHPHERLLTQELLVDCQATLQLNFAQWKDQMDSTVSYTQVADTIAKTLIEGCFNLLETAAYHVTEQLLQQDARIVEVVLRLEKQALPQADCAYVLLTRQR